MTIAKQRIIELLTRDITYDEFAGLATRLGINIDRQIPGRNRAEKAAGLVELVGQQGRLAELVDLLKAEKPYVMENEQLRADMDRLRDQLALLTGPSRQEKSEIIRTISEAEDSQRKLANVAVADIQKLQDERDQLVRHRRLLSAILFVLLSFEALFFLPWYFNFAWLNTHPKRLGIYIGLSVMIFAATWAIMDTKRRNYALGTVVIGVLTQLIQLL